MSKKMKIPGWPEAFTPSIPGIPNPLTDNPLLNNPLTNTLSGGFDFVKNLWGGMPSSVPGFIVPTIDVEELDKRIKDLKAVESWLAVNASMLRATIQGLEVQRNTIATLKTLGGSLGGSAADLLKMPGLAAAAFGGAAQNSAPVAPPAASSSYAAPVAAPAKKPRTSRGKSGNTATPSNEQPGLSATAWLGFLQDQFNRVAMSALAGAEGAAAMAPGGTAPTTAPAKALAPSATRKRAARKRGSGTR
jgi:hypothetical protein